MSPSLRRPTASAFALLAASLLAGAACSSDPAAATGVTHPTMIEVAPVDFLGNVPCSSEGSGLKRFVATAFDVTDEGVGGADGVDTEAQLPSDGHCPGFRLPSSAPTSCATSVGFGFVVPGHRYCVEVDGYETDGIEPRGSGTRQMLAGDPADGDPPAADAPSVKPSYQTTCDTTFAVSTTIVRAGACKPFALTDTVGATASLRVETERLLGNLVCGDEPGQVASLEVLLKIPGETDVLLNVECGATAEFADLPGGRSVLAIVSAFSAESDQAFPGARQAFAGAQCQAVTTAGGSVLASCSKLSEKGTLRVDLPAALESLGLGCDAAVSDVRIIVPGDPPVMRSLPPPDCLQPFDYGFVAGAASVTVTVVPAEGGAEQSLTCGGTVSPGSLVIAECEPAAAL